jgi:hypothetical protein
MTTEIAMRVSGFLYLYILASWAAMAALGNRIGMGDYDSDAELIKISDSPRKFQMSIVIALIDHGAIIALAIMLFIAFGPYSLILGIIWTAFRTGEGWILIYSEKDYWGLLNIARQYSVTSGAEKNSLSDLALTILQTRDSIFKFTQFLWAVGTLALSIMIVTSGVVPHFIGWLGIGAGILGISYNGLFLVKHDYKILIFIGFLFALPFEVIFAGWLLFFS